DLVVAVVEVNRLGIQQLERMRRYAYRALGRGATWLHAAGAPQVGRGAKLHACVPDVRIVRSVHSDGYICRLRVSGWIRIERRLWRNFYHVQIAPRVVGERWEHNPASVRKRRRR